MRVWLPRVGWALLLVVFAILIALMTWEPFTARPGVAPPPHAYKAEIVRDELGVPQIGRAHV